MKCRDCKWLYTNETMQGMYICVNFNCNLFSHYTGLCAEDDCKDGEPAWSDTEDDDAGQGWQQLSIFEMT